MDTRSVYVCVIMLLLYIFLIINKCHKAWGSGTIAYYHFNAYYLFIFL